MLGALQWIYVGIGTTLEFSCGNIPRCKVECSLEFYRFIQPSFIDISILVENIKMLRRYIYMCTNIPKYVVDGS